MTKNLPPAINYPPRKRPINPLVYLSSREPAIPAYLPPIKSSTSRRNVSSSRNASTPPNLHPNRARFWSTDDSRAAPLSGRAQLNLHTADPQLTNWARSLHAAVRHNAPPAGLAGQQCVLGRRTMQTCYGETPWVGEARGINLMGDEADRDVREKWTIRSRHGIRFA